MINDFFSKIFLCASVILLTLSFVPQQEEYFEYAYYEYDSLEFETRKDLKIYKYVRIYQDGLIEIRKEDGTVLALEQIDPLSKH